MGFSAGRNKHEAHYLMMKMLGLLSVNTEYETFLFFSEWNFGELTGDFVVN